LSYGGPSLPSGAWGPTGFVGLATDPVGPGLCPLARHLSQGAYLGFIRSPQCRSV